MNKEELVMQLENYINVFKFAMLAAIIIFVILIIIEIAMRWCLLKKFKKPGILSIVPIFGTLNIWNSIWTRGAFFTQLYVRLSGAFLSAYLLSVNVKIKTHIESIIATGFKFENLKYYYSLFIFAFIPTLLMFVLIIWTIVLYTKYVRRLARAFNKGPVFTFFLFIFNFLFTAYLAFSKCEYIGNQHLTFCKKQKEATPNVTPTNATASTPIVTPISTNETSNINEPVENVVDSNSYINVGGNNETN